MTVMVAFSCPYMSLLRVVEQFFFLTFLTYILDPASDTKLAVGTESTFKSQTTMLFRRKSAVVASIFL